MTGHVHVAERCVHARTRRVLCDHVVPWDRYRVREVPCDPSFCWEADQRDQPQPLEVVVREAVAAPRRLADTVAVADDGSDVDAVADTLEEALAGRARRSSRPVAPDERHWSSRLRGVGTEPGEVLVTIHGSHVEPAPGFPAWVARERWNGWAIPAFRREVAELVVAWVTEWNRAAAHPEDQDVVSWDGDAVVITRRDGTVDHVEPDPHVWDRYALGAWSWTWTELDG